MEGSETGTIPLTNESGSGRPKNLRIRNKRNPLSLITALPRSIHAGEKKKTFLTDRVLSEPISTSNTDRMEFFPPWNPLLCVGLGTVSDSLLPFMGPVLDLATDLQQQAHIYLLEVSIILKILEHIVNVLYYDKLKDRGTFCKCTVLR